MTPRIGLKAMGPGPRPGPDRPIPILTQNFPSPTAKGSRRLAPAAPFLAGPTWTPPTALRRIASWEGENAYLRSGSLSTQNGCFGCIFRWRLFLLPINTVQDAFCIWVTLCLCCWRQHYTFQSAYTTILALHQAPMLIDTPTVLNCIRFKLCYSNFIRVKILQV